MQAGGVFLAPTLQVLKSKNLLVPPTDPKHIFIVSNDGIPQEFQAIRDGQIDATVSQPADLYAKYALSYAKDALAGKSYKAGPTDHNSTIVDVGGGRLEDQLPAPLVVKDNVDDPNLWGNQVK
jgi:simple sugar transport system substrate-binding protein/ribose transport system substrate-binding protein